MVAGAADTVPEGVSDDAVEPNRSTSAVVERAGPA
jgi:hypothetical protein